MGERARCVIVDRSEWFRELLRGELEGLGVELVGEAVSLADAREVLVSRKPEVALVTPELDERGEGVRRLLSGVGPAECPTLVLLGQFRAPTGFKILGGCRRVGKADGVRALADEIVAAAEERRELLRAVSGEYGQERTADALLHALGLDGSQTGCAYLRHALLTAVREGDRVRAKELYTETAESFSTSPSDVERNIRFAVSTCVKSAPINSRIVILGSGGAVPGNMELIRTLAGIVGGRARRV